jgi:hypothetical protein
MNELNKEHHHRCLVTFAWHSSCLN